MARAASDPRHGGRDQGDRDGEVEQEVAGQPLVGDPDLEAGRAPEHHPIARYHRGTSVKIGFCFFSVLLLVDESFVGLREI